MNVPQKGWIFFHQVPYISDLPLSFGTIYKSIERTFSKKTFPIDFAVHQLSLSLYMPMISCLLTLSPTPLPPL